MFFLTVIAAVFLFAGVAQAGYVTTEVVSSNDSVSYPQINSSGQIAWLGYVGGIYPEPSDDEVFLYSSGAITRITDNWEFVVAPQLNDLGHIAWESWNTYSDVNAWLYSGGSITQLGWYSTYYESYPDINNLGQVVWQGSGSEGSHIYLLSGQVPGSQDGSGPRINDSGQAVWTGPDGSGGTDSEIMLYSGGTITPITSNNYHDYYPEINNSGQVVWRGLEGADYEFFLYSGGLTAQLTSNSYHDGQPQINNSGQVVWTRGWDGSTFKIYRADPCVEGEPALNLSMDPTSPTGDPDATPDGIYWASYSEYLAGPLSINYRVTNSGSEPAYAVELTGSTATNGVSLSTAMPVILGTIDAGSYAATTLKHDLPTGVGSFMVTVNATAVDACGNTYNYP